MAKQTSKPLILSATPPQFAEKHVGAQQAIHVHGLFWRVGVLEALLTIYLSQAVVSAVTQALEPLEVLAQTALIGAALALRLREEYMYAHMEPFMLDHDIRCNLMLSAHHLCRL